MTQNRVQLEWTHALLPNARPGLMSENEQPRLDTLDLIKAIALSWIFVNHIAESMWGHPFIANTSDSWPGFEERWAQLMPLRGTGLSGFAANALRYVGWVGDQAVSWFILLSGFALSISQLRRADKGQVDSLGTFYLRRFRRILPTWWTVHLLILLPVALIGWRITIADPRFFLSFLGVRVTPDQLYFGVPAWWFISLLLQLYLVFPFLHRFLLKVGPITGGATLVAVSLLVRFWGMSYHNDWVDSWNRGSIFVSRTPEFATGMMIAFLYHRSSEQLIRWSESRGVLVAALGLFALGNIASMSFHGNVIAQWFMGMSGTTLAYAFFTSEPWKLISPLLGSPLRWIGRHSLSLFLVHHPIAWVLLRNNNESQLTVDTLARILVVIVASVVLALIVEWSANWLTRAIEYGYERWGATGLAVRAAAALAGIVLLILPFELAIQKYDPQDITDFGWSERPSLVADNHLGFRLRPSETTRLRWESYDYVVTANSEGFPGPELPKDKPDDTFRVMTLGDAFTSAEGVDTEKAWPRLLETKLRESVQLTGDQRVDVVNFGTTGFGPNQYATLVKEYAPKLNPDLIIIGFFTNDYVDVQCSAEDFQHMIGFERPKPNDLLTAITGRHLFRYLRGHIAEAFVERVTLAPCSHTRFFCQSDLFDRSKVDYLTKGRDLTRTRFKTISEVANENSTRVLVMSIPAPIQCVPVEQLKYIRPFLNLKNASRYDYDQPQRMTAELAAEFGFEHLDLRTALSAAEDRQPYQSHNLHFTEAGHDVVSDALLRYFREPAATNFTNRHE